MTPAKGATQVGREAEDAAEASRRRPPSKPRGTARRARSGDRSGPTTCCCPPWPSSRGWWSAASSLRCPTTRRSRPGAASSRIRWAASRRRGTPSSRRTGRCFPVRWASPADVIAGFQTFFATGDKAGTLQGHLSVHGEPGALDAVHLHRAVRCGRLPLRAVQHRGRGPVLHGCPGSGLRRLQHRRPAGIHPPAAGAAWRCAGRRDLGRDPGLPEGEIRRARGREHDHDELDRVPAERLAAQRTDEGQRIPAGYPERGSHRRDPALLPRSPAIQLGLRAGPVWQRSSSTGCSSRPRWDSRYGRWEPTRMRRSTPA